MAQLIKGWTRLRADWSVLSYYQRFESGVALVLTLVIGAIILVALYRLTVSVLADLVLGAIDPLDHAAFQRTFGDVMTLLIALEFNHTLQYVVAREQSIIQTKVVLLIALLALARKFIVLEVDEYAALELFALAAVTLALGITYWLLGDREDRKGVPS